MKQIYINLMNNYKIKISCTSKEELSLNNKKISMKNYTKNKLLLHKHDYINKIIILYKISHKFTTKTLEFLCTNLITEIDFKIFIQNMIDNGFSSKYNTTISFIKNDNPHNPIYSYKFQTITKNNKVKQIKKSNNNSKYITYFL